MFGIKFSTSKFPYMERDKTVYAPLRDGDSSRSERDCDEPMYLRPAKKKSVGVFNYVVIILLLVTNICTIAGLLAMKYLIVQKDASEPEYTPKSAGSCSLTSCKTSTDICYSSSRDTAYAVETTQLVDRVFRQEFQRNRRALG